MIAPFAKAAVMAGLALFATAACAQEAFSVTGHAAWSTPGDGTLVMLARSARGFDSPIPFRVRVCVTNATGTNNNINLYVWTTAGFQPGATPTAQQQTRTLQLGDCVEYDQPAAIVAQDSTVTGTVSGYYEMLESTYLPKIISSARQYSPKDTTLEDRAAHGPTLKIGPPVAQHADCKPISPKPTKQYYTSCVLQMPKQDSGFLFTGYRICIGSNYIKSSDNKTQYALSLIDLVINKNFAPPMDKPADYDHNWSPVVPDGCRDVFGLGDAKDPGPGDSIYFLLGPNTPGGYWDPAKVSEVDFTLQTILLQKWM